MFSSLNSYYFVVKTVTMIVTLTVEPKGFPIDHMANRVPRDDCAWRQE